MSDRAALYAAVCANPDDDTPRLVLADWLDEHGDARPRAAWGPKRAAHIRAAVTAYRHEHADTTAATVYKFLGDTGSVDPGEAGDLDWAALDPEVGEIAVAAARITGRTAFNQSPKVEGLPIIRGVTFDSFERGFFTGVSAYHPSSLVANADAVFRAAPITRVELSQVSAEDARAFAESGYLARVRELELEDPAPAALRVLGGHRDAAGVTSLSLYCDVDADEQLAALAAGKHWTGLTELDLQNADLADEPDDAVAETLRRPAFRRLRRLSAYGNDLRERTARTIATAGFAELRELDLAINNIREAGIALIAGSKSLANLRYLDASMNEFGGTGAAALIASPRLKNLTALRLDSSNTRGLDAKVLAGPSRGPTLRCLQLEDAQLGTRGLWALTNCPAAHGLWVLFLTRCGVTDAGLAALAKGPGMRQLTALDLSHNELTERGARTLADWAVPLRWLDVSGNKFGDVGAKALAGSEHLAGLRHLSHTGRGTARLRKRFGKKVVP